MKLNCSKQIHISLLIIFTVFASFGCDDGGVCTSTTSVSGASAAVLYYPCTISSPAPATTMTSGYTGTYSEVDWLAQEVAANGFVVLAMTPTNIYGMVSGWRTAHVNGISKLKTLNTSGTLKGKINTSALQTCGHSKGGGGALWAADILGSQLKSAIGMAPWQEEFNSLSGVRAATLIQAGGLDTLATGLMTTNEFNLLPTGITKNYHYFAAADHLSWAASGTLHHGYLSADVVDWMDTYLR